MSKRLLVVLALLLSSLPAHADGDLARLMTPADKARLSAFDVTRRDALAQAAKSPSQADRLMLDAAIAPQPASFTGFDMTGNWRCRTFKAGGLSPLIAYGWFKCRVTEDSAGWRLEKVSGSQRTVGRFYDDGDKRLVYLGSGFVAGTKPPAYGAGPDSDQVGYAYLINQRHWRIEFPAPRYESKFDVLELKR